MTFFVNLHNLKFTIFLQLLTDVFRILPCGEQLSDDGCFETVLHEAEGSPETGATGAHHNSVIGVVNDGVLSGGSSIG